MADEKVTVSDWGWSFKHIPKTTPEFAKWAFRGVLYGLGVINLVLMIFTDIPVEIRNVVGRYSIEIVMFVHGVSKMFGIEVEDPATVTKEDIAVKTTE